MSESSDEAEQEDMLELTPWKRTASLLLEEVAPVDPDEICPLQLKGQRKPRTVQKKPSAAGLTESFKTAFNQLVLQKMDSSPSKHTMGPMSATLKEGKSKLDGGNFTETAEAVLDEK